ncbi:hypothetical protein EXIGLDRAFT_771236 [Exidia glandulosa HHB12029]|uniref:Uncharacterized protein n=1 Tax=Exidia glandulosa HHB12029 TaxID=1314781 RepID=A0A165G406_EXIGL|nr:hypothetical protein EXIGLDRAFT_771236 [Exidia glandulosa HHB12029]
MPVHTAAPSPRYAPMKRPVGTMKKPKVNPATSSSSAPDFGDSGGGLNLDFEMVEQDTEGDSNHGAAGPSGSTSNETQPPPETTASGRPQRNRRLPAKVQYIQDILPPDKFLLPEEQPVPDPPPVVPEVPAAPATIPQRVLQISERVRVNLVTAARAVPNVFRLSRLYYGQPQTSVDERARTAEELASEVHRRHTQTETVTASYAPYPNKSSWLLGSWFHSSSPHKSESDFKSLVDVILDPDFQPADIKGTPWARINQELAQTGDTRDDLGRGWKSAPVHIHVPTGRKKSKSKKKRSSTAPGSNVQEVVFDVPNIHYRSLTAVMDQVHGKDPASERFQRVPFKQMWQPHNDQWPQERVYGELYTSDSYIRAHEKLQSSPPEPDCNLPRVLDPWLFASDLMQLADFGHQQLWPVYTWNGAQTKYERAQPSADACHVVAYIEKLPERINKFVSEHHTGKGKKKNTRLLTHLRRELFHACVSLVLEKDPELMKAYYHGRVIVGTDGIARRHYPRFFNYSADYPEKVLLATTRDMGDRPCPRCLVKLKDLSLMGTESDMKTRTENLREDSEERISMVERARHLIYKLGYAVGSKVVEAILKEDSWTPTLNAFSWLVAAGAPSIFRMLNVDLMHEWNLGVWKALFAHLIRILHTQGYDVIVELNRRYREVPTFGNDTIRRFPENVSDMSRMAARDFEDLLLCAIPCFAGLFPPEVDAQVQRLLYRALEWHALAAARQHTDSSLTLLSNATIRLGTAMRHFRDVICPQFKTVETASEVQKRQRAAARAAAQGVEANISIVTGQRPKTFNLDTFKFHSLGDYPALVPEIGTTDSITTQTGELAHRRQKQHYERTSKKDFTRQIVARENQQETLREIGQAHQAETPSRRTRRNEDEIIGDPTVRYHIAKDQDNRVVYGQWSASNDCDTALQDFVPKLLEHCATRLIKAYKGGPPPSLTETVNQLTINRGYIYAHSRLRLNYTTYDVRRAQCTITVGSDKVDVMLLPEESPDQAPDAHPFRYARVHRIFHANVSHPVLSPKPTRLDFLWVRWFRCTTPWNNAWDSDELDKVAFIPANEDDAFGFLDPAQVLRNMHLCPSFHEGRTKEYLGPSIFRPADGDYVSHYVMRFSDRDLVFRFLGLGIGHTGVVPRILRQRQPPVKIDPEPNPPPPPTPPPPPPPPPGTEDESSGDGAGDNGGDMVEEGDEAQAQEDEEVRMEVVTQEEEEAIERHGDSEEEDDDEEEGMGDDAEEEEEEEEEEESREVDVDDLWSESEGDDDDDEY